MKAKDQINSGAEEIDSGAEEIGGPGVGLGVRLDALQPGMCGVVCRVDVAEDTAQQLLAMGVCVGRRVQLLQRGDPLILRVLGSRIGLSARLARGVAVEPCQEDSPACQVPRS